MKIGKSKLVAAIVATLALTACNGGGQGVEDGTGQSPAGGPESGGQSVQSGGHLNVIVAGAPDTLDPAYSGSKFTTYVLPNICETLYDIDADLNLIPGLAAEMPIIDDDGMNYTIRLREGVLFNDGSEFDAEAVKKSLDRYRMDPRSARASELAAVEEVTVVDPLTVELSLSRPDAPLTSVLQNRAGMIASPAQLDEMGENFGDEPVCVGPFSFVSRPSTETIELEKSEHYYDADVVMLDSITLQVITQPNVRATNLRSGEADIAMNIAPTDVGAVTSASDLELVEVPGLGFWVIKVNVSNSNGATVPPFETADTPLAQHPELREAFELSLDREAINQVVFDGFMLPGCNPISQASPWYSDVDCAEQDLDRARQLVEESGVQTPIPVELTIQAANDELSRLGTVIQSMAGEAGFAVSLAPTENAAGLADSREGNFDTYVNSWSGRIDPDGNFSPFWSTTSTNNVTGADYSDVNELLEAGRSSTDESERAEIYRNLTIATNEHRNNIVLYHENNLLGVSNDVSGVEYFSDGVIRLKTAALNSAN